jgi:hypothetical protein
VCLAAALQARAGARTAYDAEIAKKQNELRALTAQIDALRAEWGDRLALTEVTGALAARRADHEAVVQSMDGSGCSLIDRRASPGPPMRPTGCGLALGRRPHISELTA